MINIVALMGRLTADPELKKTANDVSVTSFTLAVQQNFKDKDGNFGADFITIVAWRNTAEFVCKYFTKGQLMAVDGSIQTRQYTDKDGNKRTAFEVLANNVHFAQSKQENNKDIELEDDFEEITADDSLPF